MPEYTWQQSGVDGRRHAFPCDGGYVPKDKHTAYVQVSTTLTGEAVYAAHEVEVSVATCEHAVPIAFLMPASVGTDDIARCAECVHRTGIFARSGLTIASGASGHDALAG